MILNNLSFIFKETKKFENIISIFLDIIYLIIILSVKNEKLKKKIQR